MINCMLKFLVQSIRLNPYLLKLFAFISFLCSLIRYIILMHWFLQLKGLLYDLGATIAQPPCCCTMVHDIPLYNPIISVDQLLYNQ
jgi:hypothetical protein